MVDCTDKAYHVQVIHETKNLLATIHCDGGHYCVKHGLVKALQDAKEIVIKERELLEDRNQYIFGRP